MAEIKCPNCGEVIKLDKSQYDALLNEVEKTEIDNRVEVLKKEIEAKLKAQYELATTNAKQADRKTIDDLNAQLAVLNEKLNNSNKDIELAVTKAVEEANKALNTKDSEIAKLTNEVNEVKKDAKLAEQSLTQKHQAIVKQLEEDRDAWKNYRLGDSTKDLGESLEQYCANEFNSVRAFAFPNAYFEKDNETVEGSKGDFIFRELLDGVELTSIMFDMKNEKDDTDHKHKNEDFLKKLDSDRTKKGCEYAVLVSTLEKDSELYNKGIVDVSYKYPKMYVIRPQFFVALIGLLRNMSLNTFEDKKALAIYKQENIDIANFDENVKAIIGKVAADYEKAGKIYDEVDKMCDDIVKKVENFRKEFHTAAGHIGAGLKQLDNLSVKKLTKNNPTMKARFEALDNKDE